MPKPRRNPQEIAVIDLFAGPGGLGEGFSSFEHEGKHPFRIVLSAEKDPEAQKTLELRAFVRQFRDRELPVDYWLHLQGLLTREALFNKFTKEGLAARTEAALFELGGKNRPVLERRLDELKLDRDRTIVIGGPPCQAYSVAGRSRNSAKAGWSLEVDARSYLYEEYLHVLAHVQPAAFVMENVRGILSARMNGESVFARICDDLRQPQKAATQRRKGRTYTLFPLSVPKNPGLFEESNPEAFLIRAEQYGIPQARHRVFVVGIATDLVPSKGGMPLKRIRVEQTVRDAINNLPPLRSALSSGPDSHRRWHTTIRETVERPWVKQIDRKVKRVMEAAVSTANEQKLGRGEEWFKAAGRSKPVLNHYARGHMEHDLHRYLFAAAWAETNGLSPRLADFPKLLLPLHANLRAGAGKAAFNDRFRVQVWDSPSTTVVSHISKDGHYYIHPDPAQCRSLTVREAARLQTFPDDYLFCGTRTSQYQQVGNAVPVGLARQIASILFARLESA